MKNSAANVIGIVIVVIFILLGASALFISLGKVLPYYSSPSTEARVVKVRNYERRSEGADIEYGSEIYIEYTVNGETVKGTLSYETDSIIKEGEMITIAYNPENPKDCRTMNEKIDIVRFIALFAVLAFIGWMCRTILTPRRPQRES